MRFSAWFVLPSSSLRPVAPTLQRPQVVLLKMTALLSKNHTHIHPSIHLFISFLLFFFFFFIAGPCWSLSQLPLGRCPGSSPDDGRASILKQPFTMSQQSRAHVNKHKFMCNRCTLQRIKKTRRNLRFVDLRWTKSAGGNRCNFLNFLDLVFLVCQSALERV